MHLDQPLNQRQANAQAALGTVQRAIYLGEKVR